MKTKAGATLVAAVLASGGCTNLKEADQARTDASTKGKYAVRLTEDTEKVQGLCKFVKTIEPQFDPVEVPAPSQIPDYYRTKAVLAGADTVLVTGRTGEAYICGSGPLNPDGTRRQDYVPPAITPAPAPPQ